MGLQMTKRGFLEISRVDQLPDDIEALRLASVDEGFEFMTRCVREWKSGAQRFDGEGEAFFIARIKGELVGIGGLSIDPYDKAERPAGRVRHLYVDEEARGEGVGSALLQVILAQAKGQFRSVRLRRAQPSTDRFYQERGFRPVDDDNATHEIWLSPEQDLVL